MPNQAGVGISQNTSNSFEAGKEAAQKAVGQAGDGKIKLVVVFSTEQFDEAPMLEGIKSVTGDAHMVGCTAASIIANYGIYPDAVGVAVINAEDWDVQVGLVENISNDAENAGRQLAQQLLKDGPQAEGLHNTQVVFMLLDASKTKGVISEVIDGAYKILGASNRFVGGGSSDNLHFKKSFQFFNGKIYTDSVVAARIVTKTPQAVSLKHGWIPTGTNLVVTKAEGKVVKEFDGQPALKVYMDLLKQDINKFDFSKFYNFAAGHPLGVPAGRDEFIIRDPLAASLEDNSITFVSEVPENSIVQLMEGSADSLLEASKQAASKAVELLEGANPLLILIADCVSRLLFLGKDAQTEVENIKIGSAKTPMLGFFSFGEVGIEKGGAPAFCNKTCGLYVLPE